MLFFYRPSYLKQIASREALFAHQTRSPLPRSDGGVVGVLVAPPIWAFFPTFGWKHRKRRRRRGNHTNIDVIGHTCDASYICIWDRSAPPWVGEGGSTDSQMRHYLKPGTILASIHLRLHLGEGSYRVVFSNDTDGFGSFFVWHSNRK